MSSQSAHDGDDHNGAPAQSGHDPLQPAAASAPPPAVAPISSSGHSAPPLPPLSAMNVAQRVSDSPHLWIKKEATLACAGGVRHALRFKESVQLSDVLNAPATLQLIRDIIALGPVAGVPYITAEVRLAMVFDVSHVSAAAASSSSGSSAPRELTDSQRQLQQMEASASSALSLSEAAQNGFNQYALDRDFQPSWGHAEYSVTDAPRSFYFMETGGRMQPDTSISKLVQKVLSLAIAFQSPRLVRRCAFFYAQMKADHSVHHLYVAFSGITPKALRPALDQISQQLIAAGYDTPVTFIEAGDSPSADLPRIPVDDEEHEKPVDELFHSAMELFVSSDTWRIKRFYQAVGWSDDHLAQEIKVLRDERGQLQQRYEASRILLQQRPRPDQWDHFTEWLISEFKLPLKQSDLPVQSAVHNIRHALKSLQSYELARALKKCAEPNMIDHLAAHKNILRTKGVVHVFWPMLVVDKTANDLEMLEFCDICNHHVTPNFQGLVCKVLDGSPQ